MTFTENNLYQGPFRFGPLWNNQQEIDQTWTTYSYYKLEADLNNIDITISVREEFAVASSWTEEYFKFMYSTVGRAYGWWYMNYKSDEILHEYLNCSNRKYITLMQDGQPAGFSILTSGEKMCNLSYFGILPRFAGQGLSRRFLKSCLTEASYEASKIWVYTTSLDHPAALPLYKSVGFSLVETKSISEYFPTHALQDHWSKQS